jgi:hypothetical protein
LTTDKAADVVSFTFDALTDPGKVSERTGMGGIHAALAPSLESWVEQCGGTRKIMMVSATGSVNYDLVIEGSDLDMKATYLPTFEDFYHGRFPKFNFVTDEFDCELHPVHNYVRFMLKGHMNHFEFLYSKASLARPDFIHIMNSTLQPLVEMNVRAAVIAAWFSALKSNADAVSNEWKPKKASHAIRFLTFLITLLDTGKFEIVPHGELRDAMLRLKRKEMECKEYTKLFSVLQQIAKNMAFKVYGAKQNFTVSDRVMDLDGTNTPKWAELRAALDDELMMLIRRPIEERAARKVHVFHRKH